MRDYFDKHGCDKGGRHGYERVYEPAFAGVRDEPFRLLEIGILRGESLAAWLDYFPRAEIVAIDLFGRVPAKDVPALSHPRVEWHKRDSTKPIDLGHFDFAIDDGLHTFPAQRMTFENFKPRTDVYFIEDVWPLDRMTEAERQHRWIRDKECYSDKEYQKLLYALSDYTVRYHDLRKGYQPDSFIMEVL